MNFLPRLEFEEDGVVVQGDLLGFIPVGYEYTPLPLGQIRGQHVQGGIFDEKHGFVGGYIENPTNIFAMIGCDDGNIKRVKFYDCRYVKERPNASVAS